MARKHLEFALYDRDRQAALDAWGAVLAEWQRTGAVLTETELAAQRKHREYSRRNQERQEFAQEAASGA